MLLLKKENAAVLRLLKWLVISLDKTWKFNKMIGYCLKLTEKHLTKHSSAAFLITWKVPKALWYNYIRKRNKWIYCFQHAFLSWKLTFCFWEGARVMAPHSSTLLPGKSHGQRSLVGCSPWGREESDMTERLHLHFSLSCIGEGNGNPLQCSCLENPRDREPGGLPSMGSHRVGHDWRDLAAASVHKNWNVAYMCELWQKVVITFWPLLAYMCELWQKVVITFFYFLKSRNFLKVEIINMDNSLYNNKTSSFFTIT